MAGERRAGGPALPDDVGMGMLGVNADGNWAPFDLTSLDAAEADPAATNEVNVPGAATAAVLTFAAEAGAAHVVSDLAWSYSAAPTGGRLTIADGSDTIFDIDITAAGPGQTLSGSAGKQGHAGRAMVVTLASGAGAVVGKLNASHRKTAVLVGGPLLNFGDENNSGLIALLF